GTTHVHSIVPTGNSGYFPLASGPLNQSLGAPKLNQQFLAGDVNGDRLTDLVQVWENASGQAVATVWTFNSATQQFVAQPDCVLGTWLTGVTYKLAVQTSSVVLSASWLDGADNWNTNTWTYTQGNFVTSTNLSTSTAVASNGLGYQAAQAASAGKFLAPSPMTMPLQVPPPSGGHFAGTTATYTLEQPAAAVGAFATAQATGSIPPIAFTSNPSEQASPGVDLIVNNVGVLPTTGSAIQSGGSITVSWTTQNQGIKATNGSFLETVAIRNSQTGAVIATANVPYDPTAAGNGPIGANQSVSRSTTIRLPDGTASTGNLIVTVQTDADFSQGESVDALANNITTTSFASALAPYPDLQVSGLSLSPVSNWQAGQSVTVNWNANNVGTGAATGNWTERVQLVNTTTGAVVADISQNVANQNIAGGSAAARSATFTWPTDVNAVGQFRLSVTVDSTHQLVEYNAQGAISGDNVATQQLVVGPSVVAQNIGVQQASVQDGQTISIQWNDVNQGSVAVPTDYQDRITVQHVNADGSLGAVLLDQVIKNAATSGSALASGASVQRTAQLTLPAGLAGTGNFKITVAPDSQATGAISVFEVGADGVTPLAAPITASTTFASTEHPYPNLTAGSVTVPASVNSGTATTISWTVQNTGTAPVTGNWVDRLVLVPADPNSGLASYTLGDFAATTPLAVGAAYTQQQTITIPPRISGNYVVKLISDANSAVVEPDVGTSNIHLSSAFAVTQAYTDLVPQVAQLPAQLYVNRGGNISWTVTNNGTMPSDQPNWTDRVYLSATPTLDANAVLLGASTHIGTVAVGGSYSASLSNFTVPTSVTPGNYYVIVQADSGNALYALNHRADFTVASTGTVAVVAEPKPNLVISALSPSTTTWQPGNPVQLQYTISNTGNDVANAYMYEQVQLVNTANPAQVITLASPAGTRDLAPGATFTNTITVTPGQIPTGSWQLQVTADAGNYVAEASPSGHSASTAITVVAPDLSADTLTTTGTLQGGQTVTLNWMTHNTGTADAGAYNDVVYLTRNGLVDANAVKLGEVSHAGLAAGASAASQLTFQLPIPDSGAYQFVVVSNAENTVNEDGATANNTATLGVNVAQDSYEVLAVSNIQMPQQPIIADPASATISYTVTNTGTGVGSTTTWTDKVLYQYVDTNGNPASLLLGTYTHTGGLTVNGSYTGSVNYTFPPGFSGHGVVTVVTNVGDVVWQNGQRAGNTLVSTQTLDVMPKAYADIAVSAVSASGTASSGQPLTISWHVANRGIGVTDTSNWHDQIWLTTNPNNVDASNTPGAILLGSVEHLGQLAPNDSYDGSLTVNLPQGIQGTYYIHVRAAADNTPYEFTHTQDSRGVSMAVPITLSPTPDLVVQSISNATEAKEGQTTTVSWTVLNQGTATAAGPWTDTIQMVPAGGGNPITLGTFTYDQALAAGISYTRTQDVQIPSHITGQYIIQVTTNTGGQVFEYGAAASNDTTKSTSAIQIDPSPRPDLQVTTVGAPTTAVNAGSMMSVNYTVSNMGQAEAAGQWTDNVYLSLDGKLDANSVLVASQPNTSALAVGKSYSAQTASFAVPLRYSGQVYVIVQADADNRIDEFPYGNDNITSKAFTVNDVPFADLVTSNVVAPSQSTYGSSFNVQYTVANKGSAPTRAADGSANQSWTDTVWLSRTPGQPQPGAGDILIGSSTHTGVMNVGDSYNGNIAVTLPPDVASGQYYITVWTNSTGTIAQTELASNVNPDAPKTLYSENFKASAISVIGAVAPQPDFQVTNLQAPPVSGAGGAYHFSYTVTNQGDAISGQSWYDEVYLSDNPDPNKASRLVHVGTYSESPSLNKGQSYTVSDTVQLSPSAVGQYLVVQTFKGSQVVAADFNAHTASVASVVTPAPADLQVSSVYCPAPENDSGEPTTLTYTVTNNGAAVWSGTKSWSDNVYFSAYPTFDPNKATLLTTLSHDNSAGLAAGASYTTTTSITPPPGTSGPYYVYVVTNADSYNPASAATQYVIGNTAVQDGNYYLNHAYEGPNTGNNLGQGTIAITYKEPVLTVQNLAISDPNPTAGEQVTVTWTVKNTGNRATRVGAWYDGLYLSNGTSISAGDYPLIGGVGAQLVQFFDGNGAPRDLQAGESYTQSAVVTLPTSISGNYHLIVKASTDLLNATAIGQGGTASDIRAGLPTLFQYDQSGQGGVDEFQNIGNNVSNIALPISAATPPFLQVAQVGVQDPKTGAAVGQVTAGQQFAVNYTVANNGGATPGDQGSWNDLVYLSRDRNLDLNHDTFLGYMPHTGGLAANGTYSNTATFTAPSNLSGTYYVFVVTNPADALGSNTPAAVIETPADQVQNMAASGALLIQAPPPADLVVSSLTAPTSAQVGDAINLSYTIQNSSTNVARGSWTDAVYLSTDTTWSTSAILIGKVAHSGDVAGGASYSGSLSTSLPPLSEGSWHVIVRPDIYDNVGEDSNPTLATAAGNAIQVTVPALTVGTPVATTLTSGQELLYKVTVAAGQTLRVNLNSKAQSGANELYVKYGAMPTSSSYDAAYTLAQSPSQQALVPTTQAGTYYVLVKSDDSPAATPVTLEADLVPLSITRVTPSTGGAASNSDQFVSMDIYGAGFAAGAQVVLSRPGVFQIQPASWQVLDATHIRADFDLNNVPHGLYNVEVINPDGTTVTQAYQYLVEQAVQQDVTVGVGGPTELTPGDGADFTLSLKNLGNTNTPYVRFNVGATNMGVPDTNYDTIGSGVLKMLGIPYVTFSSNVGGQPPGVSTVNGGNNQAYGATPTNAASLPNVPWSSLSGSQDINGFNIAPGYAFNLGDGDTVDATFNLQTYPGLQAWVNRDFPALRRALYALHPDWAAQNLLANGPQDLDKVQQGLTAAYNYIDPTTGTNLTVNEALSLSYRFNLFATATPLTRDQFVAEQTAYADQLRMAILKDTKAPAALQVLAANQGQWEQGWLAALTEGGVLLPVGGAPLISQSTQVMSLNAMLATGILLNNGNTSYTTQADMLGFFTQVQKWYGSTGQFAGDSSAAVAPLSTGPNNIESRESDGGYGYATSPVPQAPNLADYNDPFAPGLTQALDVNEFVGGVSQLEYLADQGLVTKNGAGLYVPTSPKALNLLQFIQQAGTAAASATPTIALKGPQGQMNAQGVSYVPAGQTLPYTVSFSNPASHPDGQIRIVTQIDPSLDMGSVQLGSIKIGNLTIQVPPNRADFAGDYDYTTSAGFILRVNAAVDGSSHAITWLLQAIDPNTGEVINKPNLGLLAGDPTDPSAPPATGFVSYTIAARPGATSGATIATTASIAFDGTPPVKSQTVSYVLDNTPPASTVKAVASGADAAGNPTYNVSWSATDDQSGVKYVTVYVAEDGGNFMIWKSKAGGASGTAVFTGQAGHSYQFLTAATDYAGNNEAASIINAVLPDDGTAADVAASLGSAATVTGTTAQTPAAPVDRTYPSSSLFQQATQALPGQISQSKPGDLQAVLAPMSLQSFASGYGRGAADIGALAMVELPNQTILASAGANNNEVYAYAKTGGQGTTPLFTLNQPVLAMVVDKAGQLWVNTGAQLLQVDPNSGAIIRTVDGPSGEPLTKALAIDPNTGLLYASSVNGVEVFDPNATDPSAAWTHFSNTAVTSLAFGPDGRLWGVKSTGETIENAQPMQSSDIVSFPMSGPQRGQAQLEYTLADTVDSLSFGQAGTPLAGLLFASTSLAQRAVATGDTSVPHTSSVWMIELASRRSLQVATGGTQGESMVATDDGRLLVAQTNSIDQIAPALAPKVTASTVPTGAMVPLPLNEIAVSFDQDMWLGANDTQDPSDANSVVNPANYTLVSTTGGT
ncbi:MAG: pre-peptidase C-terminal domain-containing protein, partial [Burkholderiales bacterium]|nr:pre-peptidase C-terminal domain-containing protein [Burkholderiales bacterium]